MEEHARIRERWATVTNEALREAGLEIRVSHIPNSQTILRPEAQPWLPRVAWEIERRGGHSALGDRARESFAQRREETLEQMTMPNAPNPRTISPSGARQSAEEFRMQSIENWRAYRAGLSSSATSEPSLAAAAAPTVPLRTTDIEQQIGSLRRELGRDDLGL
jgi:hypothetical protein